MYSPAGSGYGYPQQAPVSQMDRLNISASDPHGRSPAVTADYGRADNGYVPGSYGYYYCAGYSSEAVFE